MAFLSISLKTTSRSGVDPNVGFDQITRDYYPDLQPADLRACVQYAMDVLAAEDIHLATA